MFNEIKDVIHSENVLEQDFQESFNFLLNNQFLFRSNSRQLKHYNFIYKYSDIFRKGCQLYGWDFVINNDYGYLGYISSQFNTKLSLSETILLIVLRLIYHSEKEINPRPDGTIQIPANHLVIKYSETGRNDLAANKSKFNELLSIFERCSIIKLATIDDPDTNLPDITIYPSIEEIVDKSFCEGILNDLQETKDDSVTEEEKV